MDKSLAEIAKLVGGEIVGDGSVVITGFNGIEEAEVGQITFLSNPKYFSKLNKTKASAVFVTKGISLPTGKNCIIVDNPSLAFTKVISGEDDGAIKPLPGIHSSAVVDKSAEVSRDVFIGPNVVIEENVCIGKKSIINAGCFIGHDTVIGNECHIYPNVTITNKNIIGQHVIIHSGTVIGSDGFGYVQEDGEYCKISQIGNVVIADNVEIGANVTIDRARFNKTFIGRGTKIDNLVQIGHNVIIEENCIIISQVGISGSVKIEKNSILAGQAGVSGHLTIGAGSVVSAKTGITKSLPPNSRVLGYPARPYRKEHRINMIINTLPSLVKKINKILKNNS